MSHGPHTRYTEPAANASLQLLPRQSSTSFLRILSISHLPPTPHLPSSPQSLPLIGFGGLTAVELSGLCSCSAHGPHVPVIPDFANRVKLHNFHITFGHASFHLKQGSRACFRSLSLRPPPSTRICWLSLGLLLAFPSSPLLPNSQQTHFALPYTSLYRTSRLPTLQSTQGELAYSCSGSVESLSAALAPDLSALHTSAQLLSFQAPLSAYSITAQRRCGLQDSVAVACRPLSMSRGHCLT